MPLNCNVCQSPDYMAIKYQPRASYAICKNCAHIFQLQHLPPEYYRSLPCCFPKDYEEHCKRRAAYIADFVAPLNDHIILDIGCGAGGVMNELQNHSKFGTLLVGCTLEKVNDHRIRSIDIESDPIPYKHVDLGIMCHVLEHFRDPISVLKKVRNSLEPTGRLYIEVPSFHWGEMRSPSIFTPEHMSFFTKEILQRVCLEAGFVIEKIHESRYWGNIKAIATPNYILTELKKVDYKKVLRYHRLVKCVYPFYRISRHFRTIGPND